MQTKNKTVVVTLRYQREWDEWSFIPPNDPREACRYFADSKEDAIDTARHMYGDAVQFKIRRV